MNILVTGGTGYIGSHTVVALIEAGHHVVIVDNLSNSKAEVVNRLEHITGTRPIFYQADLCDQPALEAIFNDHDIVAVIHFAGLKAVGESVAHPLHYYHNNLVSTLNLLEAMRRHKVYRLIFSSSATVYGSAKTVPVTETAAIHPINPYGQTKAMVEQILQDLAASDPHWQLSLLRYFNPIGAHPSGLIGEDPNGIPNNLLPFVAQVAVGKLPWLNIFGNDYNTPDGTGVRDYIHVVDLAAGHLAALTHLRPGCVAYNLGTGRGHSVLEAIQAMEAASHKTIPHHFAPRRAGDPASLYADPAKAARELKWQAKLTLTQACADQWNWQSHNPNGYE
jgi:UDP-glucose 4-epimerase